ncbi:MAG: hypothetical protein H3C47_04455 [Candidatus Cloacimonetes bacterium]|nr:hypothetical protein [Candidatus Cloacimonadota bacterium]
MPEVHTFIGSDKNAGKTTALLYEYQRFRSLGKQIVVSGIGINGEAVDAYDGLKKPCITIHKDDFVITTWDHANKISSFVEVILHLLPPRYSRPLVLLKMLATLDVLIQGPNEKWEFHHLKEDLNSLYPHSLILLDGSIDRQFLGHKDICDYLYYSLYSSNRSPQRTKARSQLQSLMLPVFTGTLPKVPQDSSWCAWDQNQNCLGYSSHPAFMDEDLNHLLALRPCPVHTIWLGGALTQKMAEKLSAIKEIHIVLEDYTLWQNISTSKVRKLGNVWLRQKPTLVKIYLREEVAWTDDLPDECPSYNLYREELP